MSHHWSQTPLVPQKRLKARPSHNRDQDDFIHNFAPVARIMKTALPDNAKIAKEAKECMQECVSEFISFITSEGSSCLEGLSALTKVPLADPTSYHSI